MTKFTLPSLLLVFCLLWASCQKDESEPETNDPGSVNRGDFTWTAGTGTAVSADSAYFYPQFTTIYAFKNGLSNSLEINLSALSVGNYSLSSATGNALTFITGPTTYTASSGSFNISSASNNKLSGSFSASLGGGTLTAISGSFNNLLQR